MRTFYDGDAQQINILDERFYVSAKDEDVYYPGVTTVLEAYYKGYGFYEWLKSVGSNADEILKKAGDDGTTVHDMIDMYHKGMEINWADEHGNSLYSLEIWRMFVKFIDFFTEFKPESIVNEFKFASDKLKYGGTIDLIAKINGEIWLIDYKTSNYIHKTHELQLAAYAVAWNDLNPQYTIERTGILWLKATTRGLDKTGKKIQGEGWQLKEFDRHYTDAYKLFEHTYAIWNEENPNYKPKNLVYPARFKLNDQKT
jgi:hypothetical protein